MYWATDSYLGRDCRTQDSALVFASDTDRMARFERKAKALAALNHPNIAQIYASNTARW